MNRLIGLNPADRAGPRCSAVSAVPEPTALPRLYSAARFGAAAKRGLIDNTSAARLMSALVGAALAIAAGMSSGLNALVVCAALVATGRFPVVRRTRAGAFLGDVGRGVARLVRFKRPLPLGMAMIAVVVRLGLAVALVVVLPSPLRVAGMLGALWLVGRSPHNKEAGWWSHTTLRDAMVTAGILPRAKEGERPVTLSYRGKPVHTDHGTTVVVALPGAHGLGDVAPRRDKLAAALRIPPARLEVTRHDDDPGNVVRIHVSTGVVGERAATVATATRTTWSDPVRIGRDAHGQDVALATFEHNTLVAGRPGSGKTSMSRIVLAHYLLDPAASVYLLDGKGSRKDYGDARPLCERFVSGTHDDAVPDTLAMLDEVLALVRERNADGGTYPGALVLLEEFQDVRAAASKDQRERLDNTLGRIVRMGRAVAVHVLVSTQRPTAEDLPSGTRNLLSQKVALMLRNAADAALVLGTTPTVALPARRGQALFSDAGPIETVELDRLTDAAWRAVCQRATALRPEPHKTGPRTAEAPTSGELAPVRTLTLVPPVLDPLLDAVLTVLADADPRGVLASELHGQLPEWARLTCSTPQALGVSLGRFPEHVERGWLGSQRVWKATASAPQASPRCGASEPQVDPRRAQGEPQAPGPTWGSNDPVPRSNAPAGEIGGDS